MRKVTVVIAGVCLSLIGAWGIGQGLKIHRQDMQEISETHEINSTEIEEVSTIDIAKEENAPSNSIIFEGAQSTSDNPWNTTAGWIKVEDEDCILLTPNTAVALEIMEPKTISFDYMIHPWVKDASDGAGILIWLMDNEESILYEERVSVSNDAEWENFQLNLNQYDSVQKIKMHCNNGENGDDSGDWVVIRLDKTEHEEIEHPNIETSYNKNGQDFTIFSAHALPQGGGINKIAKGAGGGYPVLSTEDVGWDSLDVLNPSVIRLNNNYLNYYSGWDGTSWKTGLAISNDGLKWEKYEQNPILDLRQDSWDNDYIAANGSAILFNNSVYYYYQSLRSAKIGLAISKDGLKFDSRTDTPVLTVGKKGEWDCNSVADPYVIEINNILYMYYLGQDEHDVQRLGIAKSFDGINWHKYAQNPILDIGKNGTFDEKGLGEPSVIYQAPYFYMLYTGRDIQEQRNIGLAISLDGINWKKVDCSNWFTGLKKDWNSKVLCDTTLLEDEDSNVFVWYGGGDIPKPDENLNGQIGMFTLLLNCLQDSTQFDANSDWEDIPIPSTDVLKGSYAIEGDTGNQYVWCSDETNIVLNNTKSSNKIAISGYLPMELYQSANTKEIKFLFYINDILIKEEIFQEAKQFEIDLIKAAEVQDCDYLELKIKTSAYVNPRKQHISLDERDLSFILYKIEQK